MISIFHFNGDLLRARTDQQILLTERFPRKMKEVLTWFHISSVTSEAPQSFMTDSRAAPSFSPRRVLLNLEVQ